MKKITMANKKKLAPVNQQGLDIRPTPRGEMKLVPLDTFPYEYVGKKVKINFEMPEFTAICPFSDFPDFAVIRLEYIPNERCIELKSLKLYINSFRDVKIFHEHVVNVIMEDFVAACDPLKVKIEGDFHVRGNIKTVVRAKYKRRKDKKRDKKSKNSIELIEIAAE
ncbi:MAG TPA: preQ(1) synthase [Pyrinomonadaceae bacterium]